MEQINWTPLIVEIMKVIIAFIVAAVMPYIVIYLVNLLKFQIEKIKMAPIKELVYWLIREAQQRLPEKPGNEKLAFVINKIHEKFPSLGEDQIRTLIEGFIFEMKKDLVTINPPKAAAP